MEGEWSERQGMCKPREPHMMIVKRADAVCVSPSGGRGALFYKYIT